MIAQAIGKLKIMALHPPEGVTPTQEYPDIEPLPEDPTPIDAVQEENKSRCLDTVFFAGDEQYHAIAYIWGLYRSQAVNSEAPGHRLPGSNSGLFAGHESIIRQGFSKYVPKECRQDHYKGIISMGDTTDIATVEEFNSFLGTQQRLEKKNPMHRVWSYIIGNHEVLHSGTARSGSDFFGVLGFFLNLQGKRTYKNDIQLPEVGSKDNILNKEKLIQFIYEQYVGHKPNPNTVIESDDRGFKLSGANQPIVNWSSRDAIYKKFWEKEPKEDVWHLVVKSMPNGQKPENPEAEWFYASAVLMGEYNNSKGTIPLYMVGLDTMDYSSKKSPLGAINGHVSPLQIKLIESFIRQKKKENPQAKFILAGHYPATSIDELEYSGLKKLLEDESIIAFMGAHHHKRDFKNLAEPSYQIKRKSPLPQITVPAIMDFPNEMTGLKYGLKDDDLFLQFDFLGMKPESVPGVDNEVQKAFDEIKPYLLSYREAIKHITDPRIREFAMPGTSIARKIQLIVHPDFGLISDTGHLHDHLIANDVIPTMVEDCKVYLRLAENVLFLTMTEAGIKDPALKLRKAFYAHQKVLDDYYERILKGDYTNLVEHSAFHEIDEKTEAVEEATEELLKAIDVKKQDPAITVKQKELLGKIDHVVKDLHRFQDSYKYWLQHYETLKRSNRDDSDYVFNADIFSSGYYRSIQQHIERLPYGSKAHAFMALVFLESARQRNQFYENSITEKIPDHIELLVASNGRTILDPLKKIYLSQDQTKQAELERGYAPGMDPKEFPREVYHDPKPEEHFVLRAGGSFLQGNGAFAGYFGGRWHLLEGLSVPRISWEMAAGIKSGGPKGLETPLSFSLNIGDPFGLIDVGPLLSSGWAYSNKGSTYMGVGGQVNIREGLLSFNFMHKWYYDLQSKDWDRNWELNFNADIFTWLRFFDVLPPSF